MFGDLFSLKPLPDAKEKVPSDRVPAEYAKWRWKMFMGMYLGYVVFYFTRKNESFVRPLLGSDLGLDIMQLGMLGTIMYITYGVGKFLNGILADRCNIRAFMAIGLMGAALVNLAFPSSPSLICLYVLWGLNGIFQSMGFPPVAKGLVHWFAPKERATKWTLWSSSHTCGAFLIGIIASWCLGNHLETISSWCLQHNLALFSSCCLFLQGLGWKLVFYISGSIALLTSIALLFTLTDKPESVGLPKIEDYMNDKMPVKAESDMSHGEILKKYIFGNKFLWMLAFAYIFVYFVRFAALDWTTKFMVDCGYSHGAAAGYLVAMPLLGMPGGIVAGIIADKYFKGRCTPINIIYLVLLAVSAWLFYQSVLAHDTFMPYIYSAAIGFLVDGPQNLVGGVQTSRVTVQQAASAATGFTGMFGYLGAVLSGAGAAWIITNYSWNGFFLSIVLASVISIVLISFTAKQEAVSEDSNTAKQEAVSEDSNGKV